MLLKTPYIPTSKVTHMIVDKRAPEEFLLNLEKLRITAISSTTVPVMEAVSTHPDMQITHIGGENIVCEPSCFEYYSGALTSLGFNVICGKTRLDSNYPADIAYNVARVGSRAIHKAYSTDGVILNFFKRDDISIIDVAQGYTKCAVAIVNENAVITADRGIAKALDGTGMEVLVISEGGVVLEGMSCGFIGGACGLAAPNLLIFCGNIEKHADYKRIKEFTSGHGVEILSLSSGSMIDIGSVIPIKQEVIDWKNSQ